MPVSISGAGSISGLDQGFNVTTGSVGVGTTNPRTDLQVGAFGGGDSNIQLATGTSGASNILFGDGSAGSDYYKGFIKYNHSTDNLELYTTDDLIHYTGGSERLRITSDGKMGLGTNSPAFLAHIHNSGTGAGDHSYLQFTTGDTGATGSDGLTVGVGANETAYINFRESGPLVLSTSGTERLRITSAGKVLINSTDDSNATMVVKTLTDNNHPTIKVRGTNANGYTFLGDEYLTDESQFTMGLAYSGASLVTGWGVRVSTSVNDTYLSSQDTYSTKHSAIKHDGNGWRFLSNSTSQTVTNGSTVSLSERFRIGSDGDITIRGTNSQYVEAAAFQQTQASKNAIVANNGGYVSFDPLRNTNSTIISHDPNSNSGRRITFPVAGAVHFSMYQDIKVSGTTGYTQCRLYKNGTVDRYALITYTNNQWDTIMMNTVVEVAANDYLEVYYTGGTITSMDNSAWLSYNFIFYPINTNRG